MKKTFLKILAIAGAILAIMFVIILLVAIFGGISTDEFDNSLVKGLFVTLAVIYFLLAGGLIALLFINDDVAKEIVLRTDKEGATRTTVGVVKKIAKETVCLVEGVKCTKCNIVSNEFGVRLKLSVKVKGHDVDDIEKYLRPILEDAYMGKLNFKFYSIEIKVAKLQANHIVDTGRIIDYVDKETAAAQETPVDIPETEPIAENVTEAPETAGTAEVAEGIEETPASEE